MMRSMAIALSSALPIGQLAAADMPALTGRASRGIVLAIGLDGQAIAGLAHADRQVQAVAPDPATAARARAAIAAAGKAGLATVVVASGLPWEQRIANAVVCDRDALRGQDAPAAEALSALVAPGGILAQRTQGTWSVAIAPRPAGMREWTSYDGANGLQYTGEDALVAWPLAWRWVDGPTVGQTPAEIDTWNLVVAGGRLFSVTIMDEAEEELAVSDRKPWLVARDAANGARLWRMPAPFNPYASGSKGLLRTRPWGLIAALDDRVYAWDAARGAVIIDAASGTVVGPLPLAGKQRPRGSILAAPGVVLAHTDAGWEAFTPDGAPRWKLPAGDGDARLGPSGLLLVEDAAVRFVDASTGTVRWTAATAPPPGKPVRGRAGEAILATGDVVVAGNGDEVSGYDPADGTLRWKVAAIANKRAVFARGDAVVINGVAYDSRTGAARPGKVGGVAGFANCTPPFALPTFALGGHRTSVFLADGTRLNEGYEQFRLACNASVAAADGLLFSFGSDCMCAAAHLRGFYAHGTRSQALASIDPAARRPVVPGPGGKRGRPPAATDWPMLRQNPARSAGLSCAAVRIPQQRWSARIAAPLPSGSVADARRAGPISSLGAPTIAGGLLTICDRDRQQLVGLDAASGAERWRIDLGGTMDAPATHADGRVYAGCRDGWLLAIDAGDGAIAWSARIAPAELFSPSYGRMESRWPVIGGPLVVGDAVYTSAGRSGILDGGIMLMALDAGDGATRWASAIATNRGRPYNDVIIADGPVLRLMQAEVTEKPARPDPKKQVPAIGLLPSYEGLALRKRDRVNSSLHGYVWQPLRYGGIYAAHLAWSDGLVLGYDRRIPNEPNGNTGIRLTRTKPLGLFAAPADLGSPPPPPFTPQNAKPDAGPAAAWQKDVPLGQRVAAMIVTGGIGVVAFRDVRTPQGPATGKGQLVTVELSTGAELSRLDIDAEPLPDGLAATDGRLFLACADGSVRCYAQ